MNVFNFVFTRRLRWLLGGGLILAPLILLAIYSYQTTGRALTKSVIDRRLTIATLAQGNLSEQFNQLTALNRRFAGSLTYSQLATNKQWSDAANRLSSTATDFPYIEGVFITDETNVLQIDLGKGAEQQGTDLGKLDWYKSAIATNTATISNVYLSGAGGGSSPHNVIAVVSPILSSDQTNKTVGWFGFRVPVSEIAKSASVIRFGEHGFTYITDNRGRLVSHPNYNTNNELVDFSGVPVVQRAIRMQTGIADLYNPIEKEQRLAAYIGEPKYHWAIVATQQSKEAFAQRTHLQNIIKIIYGFVLFAILIAMATVFYLTSRLKAANKLSLEQAARNKSIFSSLGEGVIVVNEYGNIVEVNPAAIKMLGFSWEELKGKWFPGTITNVYDDGNEVPVTERPMLHTLETGKAAAARGNYLTKSGQLLPVYITATPLLVDNRPVGAIKVFHDRTDELQIERTKDEFVSLASHQLRTPLTAMRLFTEMLMEGQVGELQPMQKDYLQKVEQSTERMIKLVGDILSVSRLELGRLKVEPVPTNLITLIQIYIDEIAPLAKEKGVEVDFKYAPVKWPKIPLDPVLTGQIVHNLLANAVHYTKSEHGKVDVKLQRKSGKFILSVKDNGIGIPKEFKPRIFQRFGRAENAIAVEGQGTGLGLYLIKMIVDTAGGEVKFKSKQGEGTIFFVIFPMAGMNARPGEKGISN